MDIRAVFFDFQDTIARFREGDVPGGTTAYGLYVEAARDQGIDLDPQAVLMPTDLAWADYQTPDGPAHIEGSRDEESFQQVRIAVHKRRLAQAGITGDLAEAIGRRIDALEGDATRYEVYDDVRPTLSALGRVGVKRVIVSNHVWRLGEIVAYLGLARLFDGIVSSATAGYRKPHPAIYRAALDVSGVPPEATVMVGDSLSHDVVGAARAGIHGVLLDRAGEAAPPEGVRVVRSLTEVPLQWS